MGAILIQSTTVSESDPGLLILLPVPKGWGYMCMPPWLVLYWNGTQGFWELGKHCTN